MSPKKKRGKIIPNGVVLEKHENATVVFLTELGYDIELIPKSNIEGLRTPDFKMSKIKWEMKSPKGSGNKLMENTIQKASKQSVNIVIDLRRVNRYEGKCIAELKKNFYLSKRLRKLWIIKKSGELLILEK